jgi:hypothetical protein
MNGGMESMQETERDDDGMAKSGRRRRRRTTSRIGILFVVLLGWTSSCCAAGGGPAAVENFNTSAIPSTITIGVLAVFTYPNPNISESSYPYDPDGPLHSPSEYYGLSVGPVEYAAAKFQMERINANSELLPHTNLTFIPYDDQFITERGFFGAIHLLNDKKALVLMGASSSGPSGNAAFVAAQYSTPILSWAASSSTLADKHTYPYFARVCQNDATQG